MVELARTCLGASHIMEQRCRSHNLHVGALGATETRCQGENPKDVVEVVSGVSLQVQLTSGFD
jgi:hypothetical protein